MSFLITESKYTELKNSAIKNLYKTAEKIINLLLFIKVRQKWR